MNQLFSCTVVLETHRAVAYLDGELDSYTAECLFDHLAPLIKSGREVVVDLSGLSFVSSTGLVLLDRLALCAAGRGGSLCLADPSAVVRRVLEITGLNARFTILTGGALPSV